jgi:hypothetical protein
MSAIRVRGPGADTRLQSRKRCAEGLRSGVSNPARRAAQGVMLRRDSRAYALVRGRVDLRIEEGPLVAGFDDDGGGDGDGDGGV